MPLGLLWRRHARQQTPGRPIFPPLVPVLSRVIQAVVSPMKSDRGVSVVDYGLMVGLLAVIIIFAVALGLAVQFQGTVG